MPIFKFLLIVIESPVIELLVIELLVIELLVTSPFLLTTKQLSRLPSLEQV
jgi:hypothetical protein